MHLLNLCERNSGHLGAYVGDGARAPAPDEGGLLVHQRHGAQPLAEPAAVHLRARGRQLIFSDGMVFSATCEPCRAGCRW